MAIDEIGSLTVSVMAIDEIGSVSVSVMLLYRVRNYLRSSIHPLASVLWYEPSLCGGIADELYQKQNW